MEFLFDDTWIDRKLGVQRALGQPQKLPAPVFAFEPQRYPWEVPGTLNKHSVLYDAEERRFKLWYRSTIPQDGVPPADPRWGFQGKNKSNIQRRLLCYAESADGFHWERPELGLVAFGGSKANNILVDAQTRIDGVFHSVVKDPDDPDPARRYKSLGADRSVESAIPGVEPGAPGICAAYSPDGIHWEYRPRLVMPPHRQDAHRVMAQRDPISGNWIGLFRPFYGRSRRFIARAESADFERWTWPRMVLGPDSNDHPWLEFYGMSLTHFGSWRIGCLWTYCNHPEFSPMATELVYSRDGLTFQRVMPGVDFLPLGPEGAWDSRMHELLEMIERPVTTASASSAGGAPTSGGAPGSASGAARELVLFYNGANFDHGANPPGQKMMEHAVAGGQEPVSALGAARLPWGHFCGLHAATFGLVETKWLTNNGSGGVRAVCALEPGGWIKAELLDELGEVIPGWDKDACRTRDDGDGWTSFWWGDTDATTAEPIGSGAQNGSPGQVSAAGGLLSHIAKVRFHLRAATLFAFSVGDEDVAADRPSAFTEAIQAQAREQRA